MKIKRLMFVSSKISGGGAERVVSVLSSALADLGYHVDLVLYERKKDEYPISEKVNIFLLPKNEKNENRIVYLWKKMFLLRKIIKDNKPDTDEGEEPEDRDINSSHCLPIPGEVEVSV